MSIFVPTFLPGQVYSMNIPMSGGPTGEVRVVIVKNQLGWLRVVSMLQTSREIYSYETSEEWLTRCKASLIRDI